MTQDRKWYDQHHRKISKRLYAQLSTKPDDEPVPVIIMLDDQDDEEVRRRVLSLGGKILRELPIINGFSTVLPSGLLAQVCPSNRVKELHLDRDTRPCLDIGIPSVYGDRAQANGFTGRGVTIAVLDSGLHPHADFTRPTPRIIAWHDTVNHRGQPYDDHGHGTHVTGIAAGNGYSSGGKYRGMAPEASIAAVKVADQEGLAPMSRLLEGMQWVLDNREKYNIRVANLSLGSDPSESYRKDPLCRAVEKLWKAGIVVVAAAGNDGPAAGSIDTPGNDPMVITVGAVDDAQTVTRADDKVPDFSSRGPTNDGLHKPDLLAPGVNIVAPKNGSGYVGKTGTSMATPFVSGAAALILAKEPELTPDQVKKRLRSSAENRIMSSAAESAGYLNVQKLLALPAAAKDTSSQAAARTRAVRGKPAKPAVAPVRETLRSQILALVQRLTRLQFGLLFTSVGLR